MITKMTRRKIRQLINEALKPFFMGVAPTDLISRLLNDPDIHPKVKELLNSDAESQRSAISILTGLAMGDPSLSEKYPELAGDEDLMPVDLTTRSQPDYQREFGKAQSRMASVAIRAPARSIIPDAVFTELPGYTLKIKTKDPVAAERFIEEIKRQGLGEFLSYSNSRRALEAAQRGTYVVGPYPKTQVYKIIFNFVNPQWWRGAPSSHGQYPDSLES